ncbi:MAG: DUF2027 domain-containing protein [Bacteroidetes bacterium]|nr:DUF2027 domain-containing protein [Bacteroidota bacterium]
MNFKPGDRVKFLNESGGGIVRRIIDSRLVLVAIEDGFEIPVQASELLLIETGDAGSRFFDQKFDVPAGDEQEQDAGQPAEEIEQLPKNIIHSRKSEDAFMAFVPHDQKWMITGPLDVYLINNTSYDILYNLFRKNEESGWSGVDYGSVIAGTRLRIATIQRDDLPQWTEGSLQFLFHRERTPVVPLPFQAGFSISGKKFYSDTSYKESPFIKGKGIVIRITTVEKEIPVEKDQKAPEKIESNQPGNTDEFIFRHKTGEREAVVDLHIHELVEDPSSFEKVEILEYQKNYFLRCMESAIAGGFLKVIFIHGVGNGVLKDVLMDHLKKQEGIEVFDAPMHKYGVGAIEVRIPHNR